MGLFAKLKNLFYRKKETILSVRGYYMLKYCKKIADKLWEEKDFNEAYEISLEDFRQHLRFDDGSMASREDAAEVFVEMMSELNLVFCEELTEMGINSFEQI